MKNNKVINIIYISSIVLLSIHLIVYIMSLSKVLMNSDSAFIVDYALEAIKYKSFFPKNWVNSNDFWIYSLIPLIIPVLVITKGTHLFLARQIAVLIQTFLLFLLLYDLFKNYIGVKRKNNNSWKIIFLLLLSGVSGQFFFELYGDATYGSIILYMVLEIWLYFKYLKTTKKRYIIVFGIILTLLTACSLRFPIFIGAPMICCLLFNLYNSFSNNLKVKKREFKKNVYLFIFIIIGLSVGFLLHKLLSYSLLYNSNLQKYLIGDIEEFESNISFVLYNYLILNGGSGLNVFSLTTSYSDVIQVSNPLIIIPFIRVIFALLVLLIPFILIDKYKKLDIYEKNIFIYTFSFGFILIFFLVFGNLAAWLRYLTPVLFFLILLIPLFYSVYCINKKSKTIFWLFIILFSLSGLIKVIFSYYDITAKRLRYNNIQKISDLLVENGYSVGYTFEHNEYSLYRLLSEDKLIVFRLTDDGKSPLYWANSLDWFTEDFYKGKTFFIRRNFQNSLPFEEEAVDFCEIGEFYIFFFEDKSVIFDNTD